MADKIGKKTILIVITNQIKIVKILLFYIFWGMTIFIFHPFFAFSHDPLAKPLRSYPRRKVKFLVRKKMGEIYGTIMGTMREEKKSSCLIQGFSSNL